MKQHRIDNPDVNDVDEIANRISAGFRVIVQFSNPGYSHQKLQSLNKQAQTHGRNLEIRFYAHYFEVFDARILTLIPDAQCVSIDCLKSATHLETLSQLRCIAELNLGVFELDDADILACCAASSLRSLSLGDTRNCKIDLGYLSRCGHLESFHTTGHTKNIQTICGLRKLQHLSLSSIKNKDDIEFVSFIPALKSLRLMLGGRASIAQIIAAQLQTLEISEFADWKSSETSGASADWSHSWSRIRSS